jgi:predicted  nucleic acid-binding Zn-ribbon protein
MERLMERYDGRREKIRQGFFVYVETHGLEHMVEAIEEAVRAVAHAADEREQIREELREEFADLSDTLEGQFKNQRRELEAQVREVEGRLASQTVSSEAVNAELEALREETGEFSTAQTEALEELNEQIERTADMERRLDEKIEELEHAREQAVNADRDRATEEVTELVQGELAALQDERDDLRGEIERLRREREQIERARDRLDEQQQDLEARAEELEESFDESGVPGEDVMTAAVARLLELDYLGRFDITMHETESIHTPDGPFEVPDGYWDGRSDRWSDRPRLSDLLGEEDDPYQYPTNQSARYEMTDSRYFGLGRERRMVVEAVVLSHLEAYATNGFDARPADLDDLLELVNETVYEAEDGEYTHLLAIASPTGWTDRVEEQIRTDGVARTRYSQYVSLCLVDLQNGSLNYDDSDPIARENQPVPAPGWHGTGGRLCLTPP